MGGWSVVGLILLLLGLTLTGLFAVDEDNLAPGALDRFVSFEFGQAAAHWHGLVFNGLLGLVALHLAAITFYALVRRDNLVGPMLTGYRRLAEAVAAPRQASAGRALGVAIVAAGLVAALVFGPSALAR